MKIEVKKGTLPTVAHALVFVLLVKHDLWYRAVWNGEKQCFEYEGTTKNSVTGELYMVKLQPNEVKEWHYYTDRYPRVKKKPEPVVITGVEVMSENPPLQQ